MLKFLAWLLVPLLPLTGFVASIWFMPAVTPSWVHLASKQHSLQCLGYVNDGQVLLLAACLLDDRSIENFGTEIRRGHRSFQCFGRELRSVVSIIGLDVKSGQQLYCKPLPRELLDGICLVAQIADDGNSLILKHMSRAQSTENAVWQLSAYDWEQQQIVKRYSLPERINVLSCVQRKDILLAIGTSEKTFQLIMWKNPSDQPRVIVEKTIVSVGLSNDGEIVHYSFIDKSDVRTILFNLNKPEIVHSVLGMYAELHWSHDFQSFLGFDYDPFNDSWTPKRFQLKDQKFEALDHSGFTLLPKTRVELNKPFITTRVDAQLNPRRTWLLAKLGSWFEFIVDRFWPQGEVVRLHSVQTGRLLHEIVIPIDSTGEPFPHPNGESVAIANSSMVAMWNVYPFSRWYPIIGLGVGTLLATLLSWRLVRFRPNPKQNPSVIPEVATS